MFMVIATISSFSSGLDSATRIVRAVYICKVRFPHIALKERLCGVEKKNADMRRRLGY